MNWTTSIYYLFIVRPDGNLIEISNVVQKNDKILVDQACSSYGI